MASFGEVVFLLMVGAASGMGFFDFPDGAQEVLTTPRLVSYSNSDWRRHKRSVAVVPDHVTIRVSVGGENVDLWVTRSEDNTLNVPQHQMIDQPQDDFPHQNVEMYSNSTSKTVLVVQHPYISKDNVKVTGSFQHGPRFYHIQPLQSSFNDSGEFRHATWSYDYEATQGAEKTAQVPKLLDRKKRNSLAMRVENTIELFAVVDYSDYIEYASRFQASEADAKRLITTSLAYSVESANIRMQSLRSQFPEAVLRLCLVGVMVLTDPTSSSFIETNVRGNSVNETSAITSFRRFLSENQQSLPKADHFLAVTSYQFTGHSNLLAYEARIGSMCSAESITLIRDKRGGLNGMSIAHGLGHSLGARNDEDYGVSSCSAEYTMSRHQTALDNMANKGHTFQFSSCSATDISKKMSSSSMACIRRVDVPNTKIVPDAKQEAAFFNPEQVCFNELGRASDFCRDFYSFDFFGDNCFNAICSVGIFCRVPFTSLCRSVPSFERLSCGNRKWCIGSQCVPNSSARATNGDDVVAYDKINFPCDSRLCPTFRKNLGILYNTNCPLTCPRGTFTCPNVFNIQFPP